MLRDAGMYRFDYWNHTTLLTETLSQVQRFAADVVAPRVHEMDENESMDPVVIQGLFEQGVCLLFALRGSD